MTARELCNVAWGASPAIEIRGKKGDNEHYEWDVCIDYDYEPKNYEVFERHCTWKTLPDEVLDREVTMVSTNSANLALEIWVE